MSVGEDHSTPGSEARNTIVSIDLSVDNQESRFWLAVMTFIPSPRLSPEARACLVDLESSQYPWDGTELWVGESGAMARCAEPVRRRRPNDSDLSAGLVADGLLISFLIVMVGGIFIV